MALVLWGRPGHSWKFVQATKAVLTERTLNFLGGDARTSAGSSLHRTNGHYLERLDLTE